MQVWCQILQLQSHCTWMKLFLHSHNIFCLCYMLHTKATPQTRCVLPVVSYLCTVWSRNCFHCICLISSWSLYKWCISTSSAVNTTVYYWLTVNTSTFTAEMIANETTWIVQCVRVSKWQCLDVHICAAFIQQDKYMWYCTCTCGSQNIFQASHPQCIHRLFRLADAMTLPHPWMYNAPVALPLMQDSSYNYYITWNSPILLNYQMTPIGPESLFLLLCSTCQSDDWCSKHCTTKVHVGTQHSQM